MLQQLNREESDIWDDDWVTGKGCWKMIGSLIVEAIQIWVPPYLDRDQMITFSLAVEDDAEHNWEAHRLMNGGAHEIKLMRSMPCSKIYFSSDRGIVGDAIDVRLRSVKLLDIIVKKPFLI
ncbi:hypothetical protein [Kordiimonas gwangyangensis]|uniref:hypothetical protein n=1 Tax=Kordiimonas gwangyangensis TaxID=288022 RepID=UPI00037FBFB3|nr:hypothetical protein [Kordiimonas gwangyangensis]